MKKEFLKQIENIGFNKAVSEIRFFKDIPDNLLRLIISLDDKRFVKYISFIVSLKRKDLLIGNEDKIITLSAMFIAKMNQPSGMTLMRLLVNTDLINHKQVIGFASLLLELGNKDKINSIEEVLYSYGSFYNKDIITLVDYIIICKNRKQKDLVKFIIANKYMLKSKYLYKLLDTIIELDVDNYYPYVEKIVSLKKNIDDESFNLILNSLFNARNKTQLNGTMMILYYSDLTNNSQQLEYLLKNILLLESDFQLESLKIIIEKTIKNKEYDFYLPENIAIIESIIDNKLDSKEEKIKDYQALTIAKLKNTLVKSKYIYKLIDTIKSTNGPINCYYISLFLKIPNIEEFPFFEIVLNEIKKTDKEHYLNGIISLLKLEKVRNSKYGLKLIYFIQRLASPETEEVIKIINKLENLDSHTLELLQIVMNEEDFDKHDALVEIVSNYSLLGFEKTLYYIEQVKNVKRKERIKLLHEVRDEVIYIINNAKNKEKEEDKILVYNISK